MEGQESGLGAGLQSYPQPLRGDAGTPASSYVSLGRVQTLCAHWQAMPTRGSNHAMGVGMGRSSEKHAPMFWLFLSPRLDGLTSLSLTSSTYHQTKPIPSESDRQMPCPRTPESPDSVQPVEEWGSSYSAGFWGLVAF